MKTRIQVLGEKGRDYCSAKCIVEYLLAKKRNEK